MANKASPYYSAAAIQRYHRGEMSAAEMHALEKEALEDPFLADALEGYLVAPRPEADLLSLRAALQRRVGPASKGSLLRFPFLGRLGRVAAIVLLASGAGWITARLFAPEDVLADKRPVQKNQDAFTQSSPDTIAQDKTASMPYLLPEQSDLALKRKGSQVRSGERARGNRKTVPAFYPLAVSVEEENKSDLAIAPVSDGALRQQEGLPAEGYIVDASGRPVPNALVTQNGTIGRSNEKGTFVFHLPDSAVQATVHAPGYEPQRVVLTSRNFNKVVLKDADSSLSEIVITANRPKRAFSPPPGGEVGMLEPREGWDHYNDYLEEALREPEKMEKKPAMGGVLLSFEVNEAGEPVNIKVEKSLCEACDQQAIQLLLKGPRWKRARGNRGRIVIRI